MSLFKSDNGCSADLKTEFWKNDSEKKIFKFNLPEAQRVGLCQKSIAYYILPLISEVCLGDA